MRLLPLLALALGLAATASAQTPAEPSPASTFVVPAHPGEAVRVTTYAQRPAEQGRLARRYRGIHVQRSTPGPAPVVRARPVARTYSTPRDAFVRQGGTFFRLVPRR